MEVEIVIVAAKIKIKNLSHGLDKRHLSIEVNNSSYCTKKETPVYVLTDYLHFI